ncbi:hypothetical protein AUJ46_05890 [Candidatus Peregrinibacteria bacterium CG1_02_54_53]|nr:MAG: hypothetical protein AUJ46_05890 [Candidatus Peregrinibacteria bacterium CG1_02_54_53]
MTQKLFPNFEPERLREARLIFMGKGPEKPVVRSGEKMRENLEKLGSRYKSVLDELKLAASYAGDAELAKLLEDPETEQMIAAQVTLEPGNLSKKWLNEIAIVFLRKAHDAFKTEDKEIAGRKDKTTDQAKKCAEIFRETMTELEAAKKAYGEELPGFAGDDGAKLLDLLKRGAEQPKLKEKFDKLIDLQKEILWADEAALAKTPAWKTKLKSIGLTDTAFVALDTTVDPTARRKLLIELVQKSAGVLTDAEQEDVRRAIGKFDEALTGVDDERKTHLMQRFPERLKYLYRLGGSDMDAVLENAIAKADGTFSFDVFETNLSILMGAKLEGDPRKELLLILGLATDKERKVVSEDALKKAAEYLRATLKLNNPTGISLSALALRARLPDTEANELSESKLQVGLGTLVDMAGKIDTLAAGPVSDPVEKYLESVLLETKQINGVDRKVLKDKAKFLEIVSFLLYGDGANPLERGTKATQAAEKFWEDHIKALIDTIDGTGVVKDGVDISVAIKTLQVTAKAAEWHKAMRDGGIHELSWKDSVKQYASALGTTVAAAAPIWWNYIKSIPRNFWDSEGDPDLLKILNRRAALEKGKSALSSLLTTSNGAQELLKKSEVGLGHLKTAQEQAIRGDAVTSPRDNIEQARALLMANQYVIGQLDTLGWSMRSKRLRQLTLWIAMLKYENTKGDPEKGLKEAKQLLQDTAALVTPEEQNAFVDTWIAENPSEKEAFLRYVDARALVENQEGRDMMGPLRQRGLILNPRALDLLRQAPDPANPALNLAAHVGRWTMDPPEQVRASLAIALEDNLASKAFLDAFVTGAEQTYTHQGRTEKVSVIDARMAVNAIQQRLLFEMRGSIRAKEQIEDEDEFTNPVDRWLRTGLESMKDLWNTDMVGKAEVIAIAFAAYWMIKEAWKSKKGKFALLGLPILLGVNHIIKQRTGRDLLGENLRFKNKEDRTSPLEAFRRRGAALDERYKVLMQPSGQAAIRVLMDEKRPVKVEELLAWRDAVKSGGGKKFALGAPASLRVSDIEDNIGSTGSKEKAYKVAYYAFEALCGDVARINGLTGGNVDTNAEQGADLIRRRYVAGRRADLTPATMFEVIMSECQMPTKEMLENRNYLEAAADMFGYTYTEAAALVKKYGTQAWVMMKQGIHKVPEVAGAAVDYAGAGWDGFKNWAALTWAKGKPEMAESISSLWRFLSTTTVAGGMTLVSVTPDAASWVIDKSIFVANGGKDIALATYRTLLRNGVTGPILDSFIKELKSVTGWDIDASWKTPEHKEKLSDFTTFLADLEKQVSSVAKLPDNPEEYFKDVVKGINGGVTEAGPEKTQDRLLTYELARRQIFSFLAAERIRAIKSLKGTPVKDMRIALPLKPSWNTIDAAKFHEENKKESIYRYLYDNYDLSVMLAAIGNQQTFVGLMKLYTEKRPDMIRSQIFDWLLWPGIQEYVSRDEASEFLIKQMQFYVGDLLADAAKTLKPDELRQYKAYVSTLLTNVMAEMILDIEANKKPTDFKLLKDQAKEFRRQLLMRRGTLYSHEEMTKANAALYAKFLEKTANPTEPPELVDIKNDKDLSWLLRGEAPPEAAIPAAATPGASAAAPGKPEVAKESELEEAKTKDVLRDADRAKLVELLGKSGVTTAKKLEIRAKFDAAMASDPGLDATLADSNKARTALEFFLGYTEANAKVQGQKLLTFLDGITNSQERKNASQQLADNIGKLRTTYPNHPRFQRLLDEAVLAMLVKTATEIGDESAEDLKTHTNLPFWQTTLENLYRMCDAAPGNRYKDGVSQLLEYVHCSGKFSKAAYTAYENYIKGLGLQPPTYTDKGASVLPFMTSTDSIYRFKNNGTQDKSYVTGLSFLGVKKGVLPAIDPLLEEAEKKDWK